MYSTGFLYAAIENGSLRKKMSGLICCTPAYSTLTRHRREHTFFVLYVFSLHGTSNCDMGPSPSYLSFTFSYFSYTQACVSYLSLISHIGTYVLGCPFLSPILYFFSPSLFLIYLYYILLLEIILQQRY